MSTPKPFENLLAIKYKGSPRSYDGCRYICFNNVTAILKHMEKGILGERSSYPCVIFDTVGANGQFYIYYFFDMKENDAIEYVRRNAKDSEEMEKVCYVCFLEDAPIYGGLIDD